MQPFMRRERIERRLRAGGVQGGVFRPEAKLLVEDRRTQRTLRKCLVAREAVRDLAHERRPEPARVIDRLTNRSVAALERRRGGAR